MRIYLISVQNFTWELHKFWSHKKYTVISDTLCYTNPLEPYYTQRVRKYTSSISHITRIFNPWVFVYMCFSSELINFFNISLLHLELRWSCSVFVSFYCFSNLTFRFSAQLNSFMWDFIVTMGHRWPFELFEEIEVWSWEIRPPGDILRWGKHWHDKVSWKGIDVQSVPLRTKIIIIQEWSRMKTYIYLLV